MHIQATRNNYYDLKPIPSKKKLHSQFTANENGSEKVFFPAEMNRFGTKLVMNNISPTDLSLLNLPKLVKYK